MYARAQAQCASHFNQFTHSYMHAPTHTHTHTRTHTHTHTHANTHTHTNTHTRKHAHAHTIPTWHPQNQLLLDDVHMLSLTKTSKAGLYRRRKCKKEVLITTLPHSSLQPLSSLRKPRAATTPQLWWHCSY